MPHKPGLVLLFALAVATTQAQGGPPLRTDDTETVPKGKWEFNLAWQSEHTPGSWTHEGPIFDFNLGVSDRCHVNFEVPWVFVSDGSGTVSGVGNGGIGTKVRLVNALGSRPAISLHPAIEFGLSNRSMSLGISDSHPVLILPVAFQWDSNGVGLNSEVGIVTSHGSYPAWTSGFAVGRSYGRTEMLAEVHGEGVFATHEYVWIAQLGLRHEICDSSSLLLAIGKSFAHHNAEPVHWTSYVALQLRF